MNKVFENQMSKTNTIKKYLTKKADSVQVESLIKFTEMAKAFFECINFNWDLC